MAAGEVIRTFVAIAIPDRQRAVLGEHIAACSRLAPKLRWVPAANLHLTLRFVGQTSPGLLATLVEQLLEVPFGPFDMALGGAGQFGRGARARVCWIGVSQGREALQALAAGVEGICRKAGIPAETRPYNPHLTLARSREREGIELPSLPPPPQLPAWRVEEFGLYQSRLGRGGPTYSILDTFSI